MLIKSIELQNIRSHASSLVEFREGINVITGNTGSGKSSVLMAIEYCLFGKIADKNDSSMMLRRKQNSGKLISTISDSGQDYIIERGLKRVKDAVRNDDSMNKVLKNGLVVDLQNRASDLNEYVTNMLGITSESPRHTFEAIVYIKQDELKELIFDTTQEKQEYIDALLQLDRYARTYDRLKSVLDEIKNSLDSDKKAISFIENEDELVKIELKRVDIKLRIEKVKKDSLLIERELQDTKANLNKIDSDLKFANTIKEKHNLLVERLGDKKSSIEKNLKAIEELQKGIDLLDKAAFEYVPEKESAMLEERKERESAKADKESLINKAKESFYRVKSDYSSFSNEERELNESIKSDESKLKTFEKMAVNIKSVLEERKNDPENDELIGRISQLKNLINELYADKTNSLSLRRCSICGETITDESHINKEYESRSERYKREIARYENIINENKTPKKALELEFSRATSEIENLKNSISKSKNKLSKIDLIALKNKLDSLSVEINSLNAGINTIEEVISAIDIKLSNLTAIRKKVNELEIQKSKLTSLIDSNTLLGEEIVKLTKDIADVGFDSKYIERLENSRYDLNSEYNRLSSDDSKLKKEEELKIIELQELDKQLNSLKEKIAHRKSLDTKIKHNEYIYKKLGDLREDIREIRGYVRDKFIGEFKSAFLLKFNEIRGNADYTVDIDNDYNLRVIADNEVLDARSLSGGEKTSVALAYRIALSSIASILGGISKNELLIMDEPTSGLDKEDINALSDAITKIRGIKQIIIVTHENSMKNVADRNIIISKSLGSSKVVISDA